MPHKESAKKRLRQTVKRTARNRAVKSRVATALKKVKSVPPADREQAVRAAVSVIDRAAKSGVMKKATADRRKSRLMRAVRKA